MLLCWYLRGPRWPLVKILDIGGKPVVPSFSDEPEVPPIPAHVHNGIVVDGVMVWYGVWRCLHPHACGF